MNQARLLAWVSIAAAISATTLAWTRTEDVPSLPAFLFWIALLLAAEVLPVSLGLQARVTMSFPITVAIAVLFPPAVAMTIAAIGAFDGRELKGEIPLWLSIFNRAQLVLAVGTASAVMALYNGDLFAFPAGVALICVAVVAHVVVNLGLVTMMLTRYRSVLLRSAIDSLLPKPVGGFLVSQAVLGALGIATAAAYLRIHFFVAAFLIPLLFARLSLLGAKAQQELAEQVQRQQQALLDATEKVFQDRERERNAIAEEIHDSALQLLVGAAYASSNSLHYLEDGKVDDARVAIASNKAAVEDAISDLRLSLTDLRRSSIEQGGLMETIETFAEQMRVLWAADIRIEGRTEQEPPIPCPSPPSRSCRKGLPTRSNTRNLAPWWCA